MKNMGQMTDLSRSHDEIMARAAEKMESMHYPPGMCICLDPLTLEKMKVDSSDVKRGDMLHFFAMGTVEAIRSDGTIEMQITHAEVEDEAQEDRDFKAKTRYGADDDESDGD
jgi:hypothetical protein